jgi:hypothetical protein
MITIFCDFGTFSVKKTYSEWGASATDITSFLGSGALLLA